MRLVAVFLTLLGLLVVACSGSGDAVDSPSTEVIEQIIPSTLTPVPTTTPRPTEPPEPTPAPPPLPEGLDNWDPSVIQAPALPAERLDLSQLDAAATEAKLIELLEDGWVMYTRVSLFNNNHLPGVEIDLRAQFARTTSEIVRIDYPETLLFDSWTSADPAGGSISVSFEFTPDGDLLNAPVQLADSVARVDMATGVVMEPDLTLKRERSVVESVTAQFTATEGYRERGDSEALREYLGRPSVIFEDTFEYQIANQFIQHQIRKRVEDDGSITLFSEFHTLDFAMLPPGSMPEIPSWPPN